MTHLVRRLRALHPSVDIAFNALTRNRLQTGLTVLGIAVGVGTVLAMMAVGAGAQRSIEQQVRAAGLNQITIKAGNWKPKTEDSGAAVAHQGDAGDTLVLPVPDLMPSPFDLDGLVDRTAGRATHAADAVPAFTQLPLPQETTSLNADRVPSIRDLRRDRGLLADDRLPAADILRVSHPEDDPMEKHDHPLAWQRLGDLEAGLGAAATLSFADAEAIRDVPGVQYVACGVHANARVHLDKKRWFTRMHGTDLHLLDIKRTWTLTSGRFFTEREQERAEQVMVLGQVVAEKLFGLGAQPIGQTVTMWNQAFRVVGVVSSSTWVVRPAAGDDEFDAVYMPYTTTHRLLNLTKLNDITVTAASSGAVTEVAKRVAELLRQRHRIGDTAPDDFTISTQATRAVTTGGLPPNVASAIAGNVRELERVTLEQLAGTLERSSNTMRWLLAAVAAVSLLVGGIGIMNVILLSVTERTREIGLRLAVGARSGDVMRQFLTEAVAISLAGGLIGIVAGVIASFIISNTLRWATVISPEAILVSFGIAAAIGVFFGWYPARKAAALDPIAALRHE
ncbi:MAG: ABC transporter permease [Acidobacteriota bacterium]